MMVGRWKSEDSSPGLLLQTLCLTDSNHSTSKYFQRLHMLSDLVISATRKEQCWSHKGFFLL